ncbi:hypothetical protein [Streptomyces sp. GbtcB6]|uniref:hypothetical protein n=1 Tax=Streptomyces sp. GbtcB6 TaxID=2824751 RepID=UPI001C2F8B53|nr:hypothetical protein [Streptomyces sp. GbtcB6]
MSDHAAIILLACVLVTLIAILAATAAGYLARRGHATYPAAFSRAAITFAATLALTATVTSAMATLTGKAG